MGQAAIMVDLLNIILAAVVCSAVACTNAACTNVALRATECAATRDIANSAVCAGHVMFPVIVGTDAPGIIAVDARVDINVIRAGLTATKGADMIAAGIMATSSRAIIVVEVITRAAEVTVATFVLL